MAATNILTINQPHMPDFTNPLGLLVLCHERIEAQLNAIERAAEILSAGDTGSLTSVFAAVDAAGAHFAIAGVKHTEDEEVSLFPRLRERGGIAGEDALAAMAELESQHRAAEKLHTEFDQLVRDLPRDGSADGKQLRLSSCGKGLASQRDSGIGPRDARTPKRYFAKARSVALS